MLRVTTSDTSLSGHAPIPPLALSLQGVSLGSSSRYTDSHALIQHDENLGDLGEAIVRTGRVAGEQQPAPRREEH